MDNKELDIASEKEKLKIELLEWFNTLNNHLKKIPKELNEQLELLSKIKINNYEDMNQIQHKAAIISVAEKFQIEFPEINKWTWHPKQTSNKNEGDLTGYVNDKIVLNAEVTTSLKPIGTIDKRIYNTLKGLSKKEGEKYFIVQSDEMLNRANTKINKNKWDIKTKKFEKGCP